MNHFVERECHPCVNECPIHSESLGWNVLSCKSNRDLLLIPGPHNPSRWGIAFGLCPYATLWQLHSDTFPSWRTYSKKAFLEELDCFIVTHSFLHLLCRVCLQCVSIIECLRVPVYVFQLLCQLKTNPLVCVEAGVCVALWSLCVRANVQNEIPLSAVYFCPHMSNWTVATKTINHGRRENPIKKKLMRVRFSGRSYS